jgi:protein SCO1/2
MAENRRARLAAALAIITALLATLWDSGTARAADAGAAHLVLPDVALVDQDGTPRKLGGDLLGGRLALVSFVFTGCTTICSPVGANMGALDHLLGARAGSDVDLISVTLDPYNDTPATLAKWRAQFDDAAGWRLVTGEPRAVQALLHAMQADAADINGHDAFLWLGDPKAGTWHQVSSLAAPAELLALVDRLAPAP